MKYDVIIVGAGAAGLMAMRKLAGKGLKVCLLEAASIPGGRINTKSNLGFSEPVETGAEFINGKLPLTISLLKEANIPFIPVEGEMVTVRNGEWLAEAGPDEHWKKFMAKLKQQETDITIDEFLQENFPGDEYADLHKSIKGFAEGFDLADPSKASILSVRDEWKHFDEEQYRVAGGYQRLISFLHNACLLPDTCIEFDTVVNKIEYKQNDVTVYTSPGKIFVSKKIIVTVSVGLLQSNTILFEPGLTAHDTAIRELGFGTVIKFLLEFKIPFWKQEKQNIGFLVTDQMVPTWWTQYPAETNLLTGWLGGPGAEELAYESEESLLEMALKSLSIIFKKDLNELKIMDSGFIA